MLYWIAGLALMAAFWLAQKKFKRCFSFKETCCLITGGSSGLGFALAEELLKRGASVILVARGEANLKQCCATLSKYMHGSSASIQYRVCDVTNYESIESMLVNLHVAPDVLFCCAGVSKPGNFLEQPLADFEQCMRLNYFGTLYTIKVVMISSTAGLASFFGYSAYAPTKNALRSLADCLRDEVEVATRGQTTVHIYFTSTISSEGYAQEQRTKPQITKNIEGAEMSDPAPNSRAITLLNGIENGQFHITSDLLTNIFRVSMAGISPRNNALFDTLLLVVGWFAIPVWKYYVEYFVIQ